MENGFERQGRDGMSVQPQSDVRLTHRMDKAAVYPGFAGNSRLFTGGGIPFVAEVKRYWWLFLFPLFEAGWTYVFLCLTADVQGKMEASEQWIHTQYALTVAAKEISVLLCAVGVLIAVRRSRRFFWTWALFALLADFAASGLYSVRLRDPAWTKFPFTPSAFLSLLVSVLLFYVLFVLFGRRLEKKRMNRCLNLTVSVFFARGISMLGANVLSAVRIFTRNENRLRFGLFDTLAAFLTDMRSALIQYLLDALFGSLQVALVALIVYVIIIRIGRKRDV